MIRITNLLLRWNVTTTMRVISGLSLIILLMIIGMNYRTIDQVHAIGNEIHQTTQRHKDLWQSIALSNARAESIRHTVLHTQDATSVEQMHKVLDLLNNTATTLQDQDAKLVQVKVAEYARIFDNLTNAFVRKNEKIKLLQKQREALETIVYEANNPALETTIVELKPNEFSYFWNPILERAKSIEVFLDSLERDVSGLKNGGEFQKIIREYRKILHVLIGIEAEVKQLGGSLGTVAQEVENIVFIAVGKADRVVEEAIERSEILVTKAKRNAIIWAFFGLLLPLILTFIFDRSFCSRIGHLMDSLHRVAQGNLLVPIEITGSDEISTLARATNEMRVQLAQLIEEVEATAATNYQHQERERIENEQRMQTAVRERERQVGGEIAELAAAFIVGDLSKRMLTAGREGVLLTMSENINRLADTINNVIVEVSQEAAALAEGDIEQRIDKDYQGAYLILKDAFNTTSERLTETVREIDRAVTTIASVSGEISTGTVDLSQRTEQQAASLEETASSVEQLTATVRANTENTQHAKTMAIELRHAAEQGSTVAGEARDAMQRIEDDSSKIADIISVIDNIAFQTNLLSLNAAVEAARAGDAGRGFAVVAQEVRMLAQRSALASKEIKTLIVNSNNQIKNGVERVRKAGDALTGIVNGVQQISTLIADIARGSLEQSTALGEISIAIDQMEEMTQRNAALAEETTAAVESMADQTSQLRAQMSFFKLQRFDENGPRRLSRSTTSLVRVASS
ncbi:methyl-accepting chemotaxis protein [Gammaproteobacteria bacterium]